MNNRIASGASTAKAKLLLALCAGVLIESKIGVNSTARAALNEQEFNAAVDQINAEFAPVAASHGATLIFQLNWDSDNDLAMTGRTADQKRWYIKVWGGTPKFSAMTPDSFMLILCHEMGHHLGGYPFYAHDSFEWAATEGQSDYWATQACAKRMWGREAERNAVFANVKAPRCESLYSGTSEVNLCKRIYSAAETLGLYLGKNAAPKPTPNGRDKSVVRELFVSHSKPQCRLDTTLEGLWCTKNFDFSVVPGRANPLGQNTISSEKDARATSCFVQDKFNQGTRPLCWFKAATLERAPADGALHVPVVSSSSDNEANPSKQSDNEPIDWIVESAD